MTNFFVNVVTVNCYGYEGDENSYQVEKTDKSHAHLAVVSHS
jgi:hypothetical protein